MPETHIQSHSHQLLLSRSVHIPGERSALFARVKSGELTRVIRGCYIPTPIWNPLSADDRYRLRLQAVAEFFGRSTVFSHESAAALWRLPWVGGWSSLAHSIQAEGAGGGSGATLVRHTRAVLGATEVIDGLRVTTMLATVVDLAASLDFARGVVIADAALRRSHATTGSSSSPWIDKHMLRDEALRLARNHGAARAQAVIDFAHPRADRPGESLSRVSMHRGRVSMPELQVGMRGASGRWYTVDFWWPRFNVIGEFDGRFKYSDPAFLSGRTPEQVLYDEKLREDDLRAAGHGFIRWPWSVASRL